MPPKPKPDPAYEPDPDAPQDSLPPPPGMAKHSELRWFDDFRFDEVIYDAEPDYVDPEE